MKERNIKINIDTAREWYNSDNRNLRELALQAFDENELKFYFRDIITFCDACNVLRLRYIDIVDIATSIEKVSRASAAAFKLDIVRRALNFGQDLEFAKNPKGNHFYYPTNPLMTVASTYYREQLTLGNIEIIGKIEVKGKKYNVLNSFTYYRTSDGLSDFNGAIGRCSADANLGFLGCANNDIAQHFGKYFGMLITEAKYGSLINDFKIIESKYNN